MTNQPAILFQVLFPNLRVDGKIVFSFQTFLEEMESQDIAAYQNNQNLVVTLPYSRVIS